MDVDSDAVSIAAHDSPKSKVASMTKDLPIQLLLVIILVMLSVFSLIVYLLVVARAGIDTSYWFIPTVCLLPMLVLAIVSTAHRIYSSLRKKS